MWLLLVIALYDPWYCEVPTCGITMPDKVAHYYRSYFAVKVIDWEIVATGNILYELYDHKRGVGYSWKDNVADMLGVVSGRFLSGDKWVAYLTWEQDKYILTFNYVW